MNIKNHYIKKVFYGLGWGLFLILAFFGNAQIYSIWVEQGPGPALEGQDEIPAQQNPVVGAVNAVVFDPGNANLAYAGAVGGGIWKSTNVNDPNPIWTELTDNKLPTLSISSLALSPVNSQFIFAGTGSNSSFELGSPGLGVARSLDAGNTWDMLATTTFNNRRVNSIVPTSLDSGNVVLAATLEDNGGVHRSTNALQPAASVTFPRISGNGTSGLPDQGCSSLVADPGNSLRFYAGIPTPFRGTASGNEGVYRSDDGGVNWAPVGTGTLTGLGTSLRILLAVQNNSAPSGNNVVYAMIIDTAGALSGVFRSIDLGATWVSMGVPTPPLFSENQGNLQGAIVAHPTDPNLVYIGGDTTNDPGNICGPGNFFGNIQQGNASLLPSNPWTPAVCSGANNTAPHADSRGMVFDPSVNLVLGCDGGIFRLSNPTDASVRAWSSLNGNIRVTEAHSVAYDPISKVVISGNQDTGTTFQQALGNFTWNSIIQGDGGVVAVDFKTLAASSQSIRYYSFHNLLDFSRSTWNASNTLVSGPTQVGLLITNGPNAGKKLTDLTGLDKTQFYQPYVLNEITPSRMLIGTRNIYESFDMGDTLTDLGSIGFEISSLAYGGRLNGVDNPDVFYVGTYRSKIWHRVNAGDPVTELVNYPGNGVASLVINPQNYLEIWAADNNFRIWHSSDGGVSWNEITFNLTGNGGLTNFIQVLATMESCGTHLLAGGQDGVFIFDSNTNTWSKLETLPNTITYDLHWNDQDKVLVAGLLGRSTWTRTLTPTTTTLTSSRNPSLFGQAVTFTATVSPSGATGTVTFFDGTTPLGTATLSGGVATFTTSSLSVGSHSITAVYCGDTNFATSTSNVVNQVVEANVFPPEHVKGCRKSRQCAACIKVINVITWKAPSQGITPVEYRIYRDKDLTRLVAVVSADEPLKFVDKQSKKHRIDVYYIVSVDQFGNVSTPVKVKIKRCKSRDR